MVSLTIAFAPGEMGVGALPQGEKHLKACDKEMGVNCTGPEEAGS
jgi:hypothetical protein